jgi:hypothetical protein
VVGDELLPFQSPHNAEHYTEVIAARVNYRTTDKTTLVSITSDGASIVRRGAADIVGSRDAVWCLAHLIQLIVNDVINAEDQPYLGDITIVRQWIVALRSHIELREAVTKEQQELDQKVHELALDVKTRWNSVLIMVKSFLRFWPVISKLLIDGHLDKYIAGPIINETTVTRLYALCGVLEHFAKVTALAGLKDYPFMAQVAHWLVDLSLNLFPMSTDSVLTVSLKTLLSKAGPLVQRLFSMNPVSTCVQQCSTQRTTISRS